MPPARRLAFFISSWVAIAFLNALIIAPAPVFPDLMAYLGVGKAAVGALISILLLAAILVQIPGAYFIDRLDNRRIVAVSILGLNLATLPTLSQDYAVVLVSRFGTGLFVPLIFVSIANMVSQAFPESRARALGAYLSAPPAGYALGNFGTPYLPPVVGLPSISLAYALPILALLPLLLWTSRGASADRGPMYPLKEYMSAFRSPELWRLGLAFAATYALYIFFTSWMPTFLVEESGVSLQAAGALAALVPAFGILSRPLGGFLADSTFKKDKRWVPLFSFLAMIPLAMVWTAPGPIRYAALLLPLAGFFIQLPFSVYYVFSSQILPPRLTGSAYTFMNTTSLIGGAITPYLAGYLADLTGTFQAAFYLAAGLSIMGLVLVSTSRER